MSAVLAAFAFLFTRPSWACAQALLCGTLLAPANHTIAAALRVLGLAGESGFQNYHRLLNRSRWSLETTFQETRLYLGVEGQRQWNDQAVARTTPIRLALFSLVTLMVQRQPAWQPAIRRSAWYEKARPTFADALAQVRRALWQESGSWLSDAAVEEQKPAQVLFEHFGELLDYAT